MKNKQKQDFPELEKPNIKWDVEKVKNQMYEISYIHYILENESWISTMCKIADFGHLNEIIIKINLRTSGNYLVTDVKLIEQEIKKCD